jgi:hypothetical protein
MHGRRDIIDVFGIDGSVGRVGRVGRVGLDRATSFPNVFNEVLRNFIGGTKHFPQLQVHRHLHDFLCNILKVDLLTKFGG